MRRFLTLSLVILLCFATAITAQEEPLPTRADLDDGWTIIQPGGDAICSRGTPYMFYAREGASDHLLIEFQGGGACWNDLTCGTRYATYDDHIDPTDPSDSPILTPEGIHDLDNPDNPFADYDMVIVMYCTGDVHMGARDATYTTTTGDFIIHHQGVTNAAAALEWTYANFSTPESVFVTGCSAGSLGASFHAPSILARYEGARAAVLGDSAGGYRGDLTTQFSAWGTPDTLPDFSGYADETLASLSFNTFWLEATALFPNAIFAQYNTAYDENQTYFARIAHTGMRYVEGLAANLDELAAHAANFVAYTAGGDLHCILPRPDFYTYTVGDARFRDWTAALAAGDPVASVACTDCADAETVTR